MSSFTSEYDIDAPPKRKTVRSTTIQLEYFIKYMVANPDLIKSHYHRSPEITKRVHIKWNKLKKILNQWGPEKGVDQWKHTWRDLARKVREKQRKGVSSKGDDIIMKALENVRKFSFHNIEPWTADKMWIPIDKSRAVVPVLPVSCVKQELDDPLDRKVIEPQNVKYLLEVGFLNDNRQTQSDDHEQVDETQEALLSDDEQNNLGSVKAENNYQQAESPGSSRSTMPSPEPPRKKRKTTLNYVQEEVEETIDSGDHDRDIDVLNTLNKFIEYEKEKDKQQHEREMTRIKQTEKLLDVMDKIANVFVDLAPSIKNFLDQNSDR